MIGNLIASRHDAHSDMTIILSSDSAEFHGLCGIRCTLLSFANDDRDAVEIWGANDPGIYGTAWQTLCIAGEPVI